MAKKLFVGGIPYRMTSADLEELFASVGTVVSARIIIDRMTNRSKGFGFVEMSNDEEADEAIKKFNDSDWDGKKIVVNEARPREENR